MEILTVEKDTEGLLKKKAIPVTKFDDKLAEFALDLNITMQNVKWGNPVGLAANQVGDPRALFIAEGVVYVNPEITWITRAPADYAYEGCYSLEPNKNYEMGRAPSIMLKWQDLSGMPWEKRFNGFHARVIQHEMDHLEGKLCNRDEEA